MARWISIHTTPNPVDRTGGRRFSILLLLAVVTALVPACAGRDPAPGAAGDPRGAADAAPPVAESALAGTEWRLVRIVSVDDRVDVPDDPSRYTLTFGTDGSVKVRADCNMGRGSWRSASAGELRFGPMAATRAECPPGSLYDRYMAQFAWVRSYAIRDGRLLLATMADGPIVEFEPVAEDRRAHAPAAPSTGGPA